MDGASAPKKDDQFLVQSDDPVVFHLHDFKGLLGVSCSGRAHAVEGDCVFVFFLWTPGSLAFGGSVQLQANGAI